MIMHGVRITFDDGPHPDCTPRGLRFVTVDQMLNQRPAREVPRR